MYISPLGAEFNVSSGKKLRLKYSGKKLDLSVGKSDLLDKCIGNQSHKKAILKNSQIIEPKNNQLMIDFDKGTSKLTKEAIENQNKAQEQEKNFIDVLCDIVGEFIKV